MSGRGSRSLVANAGSERQVRAAQRREKARSDRLTDNLKTVLGTPAGRAVIYGLLVEARVYASVWSDHGSRMAFNVGQQDYGHWLLAQCIDADEALMQIMEREGRMFERGEDRLTDAATSAEEGTQE